IPLIGSILTKYRSNTALDSSCRVEPLRTNQSIDAKENVMLQNREGQRVPEVTFHLRENNQWKHVTTNELFAGKTVVVFSLPGAFTPTCSSTHLPRYNELAPAFFANGVHSILCVSVNDTFVMNEWAKDQEADNVRLIPDGNGEFTE